jgi:hypothetical protein
VRYLNFALSDISNPNIALPFPSVTMDLLRHPADFWLEDIRSLSQASKQTHSYCQQYLKKFYQSCARRILTYAHRDFLLSAANQLRKGHTESFEYGIRRAIQNNIEGSPILRKQFPNGAPRHGSITSFSVLDHFSLRSSNQASVFTTTLQFYLLSRSLTWKTSSLIKASGHETCGSCPRH